MIRKLRIKVILLAMTVCVLVLAVIITGINLTNWSTVIREADQVMRLLWDNHGRFPMGPGGPVPPELSPEAPYENRYFSVELESGNPIKIDTGRIAAVDAQQAAQYASHVLQLGRSKGFYQGFRYWATQEQESARLIFLDCGRRLDAFYQFLVASILISLLGLGLVLGLLVFFSGRLLRPIAESYEKQKQFITDAGHELKTPLTVIRADTDVLAMELENNEWLEDIRRQTERLAQLTGQLVQLSRMEEADRALPMLEFSFSDTVEEAAASFQALAQTQDKQLVCRIQPMLTLKGNAPSVQQLVGILLENALKYSPAGDRIALQAGAQGKYLQLTVENTPLQPIAPEQLERMFERFYRLDPARSSATGGTGIGLCIARAITGSHNGRIFAQLSGEGRLRVTALFPS